MTPEEMKFWKVASIKAKVTIILVDIVDPECIDKFVDVIIDDIIEDIADKDYTEQDIRLAVGRTLIANFRVK